MHRFYCELILSLLLSWLEMSDFKLHSNSFNCFHSRLSFAGIVKSEEAFSEGFLLLILI